MKKISLLITLLLCATIVGCNDVPEDVKSRAERQKINEGLAGDEVLPELSLVSFDEVKKELDNYNFPAHSNLHFNCQPPKLDAETVYNITPKGADSYKENEAKENTVKALRDIFYPELSDDDLTWELNEMTGEYQSTYKNGMQAANVYPGTTVFKLWDLNNERADINDLSFKAYTPESVPKDSLVMLDGSSMSTDEAISYGTRCIRLLKGSGLLSNDTELRLSLIGLCKYSGAGGNAIALRYDFLRHGLPCAGSGFFSANLTDPNSGSELYFVSPAFEIILDGKDHPMAIWSEAFANEGNLNAIEKIMPLSVAEGIACYTLAPKLEYEVSNVQLEYCHSVSLDHTVKIIPMWTFTLEMSGKSQSFYNRYRRVMMYVDAVTGDSYYSDPSKSLFLSVKYGESPPERQDL